MKERLESPVYRSKTARWFFVAACLVRLGSVMTHWSARSSARRRVPRSGSWLPFCRTVERLPANARAGSRTAHLARTSWPARAAVTLICFSETDPMILANGPQGLAENSVMIGAIAYDRLRSGGVAEDRPRLDRGSVGDSSERTREAYLPGGAGKMRAEKSRT